MLNFGSKQFTAVALIFNIFIANPEPTAIKRNLQLSDTLHYPFALPILYSPCFSLFSVSNLYSVL